MEAPGMQIRSADPPRSFTADELVLSCEPWTWSFLYKYHNTMCAQCFKESENLRTCSNCQFYRYCDTKCQAANWKKEHKNECEMLKKIQANISNEKRDFAHECSRKKCGEFGCLSAEIITAKIINKITKNTKDAASESGDKMSAMEILKEFPQDANYEKSEFKQPDASICKLVWSTNEIQHIPDFDSLIKKVYYNIFPIFDQTEKTKMIGAGIFPTALLRAMTLVCLDTNVTLNLRGRTVMVHATEDIPAYTGLKDLRQNELVAGAYIFPMSKRRAEFKATFFRACTCRKCTEEYNAELNPLKCSTKVCSERIPSDQRARRPCRQCGARNDDQLIKYQLFTMTHEDFLGETHKPARWYNVLSTLDSAEIVHPEAHIRYICGVYVLQFLNTQGRFEDAWTLACGVTACARVLYPKYHLTRARSLMGCGLIPLQWFRKLIIEGTRMDPTEAKRVKSVQSGMIPKASEWMQEAQEIYTTLSGADCKWVKFIGDGLEAYAELGSTLLLNCCCCSDANCSEPLTSSHHGSQNCWNRRKNL